MLVKILGTVVTSHQRTFQNPSRKIPNHNLNETDHFVSLVHKHSPPHTAGSSVNSDFLPCALLEIYKYQGHP